MVTVSITEIINICSLAIFLCLIMYHLFIFFGRRNKKEEIYNLYFSLFAFAISIYLLFSTSLKRFVFPTEETADLLSPSLMLFSIGAANIFLIKMLSSLFKIPKENTGVFRIAYIFFLLSFLSTLINIFIGKQWYKKNIFTLTIVLISLGVTFYIIFFIRWLFINKHSISFMDKIVMFCIIIGSLDFLSVRVFEIFTINFPLRGTYIISGLLIFVFAFAAAEKFNREHKELIDLKTSLEQKVREKSLFVEKMYKEREDYTINFIHEIKTPYMIIRANLEEHIVKKGGSRYLDVVEKTVDETLRDIFNFMDIFRMTRVGALYAGNEEVINVSDILKIKIEQFRLLAKKRDIDINATIDNNIFVKMSRYAIDRVLNNIFDNATKYNRDSGKINVCLYAKKEAVAVMISDTGIGIPREEFETVFMPFYRITKKSRYTGGIGAGLPLTKKILNEVNGDIEIVESSVNVGTTFKITLPRYKPAAGEIVQATGPVAHLEEKNRMEVKECSPIPGRCHILIVEDNEDILDILHRKLSKKYNIYIARNGIQAMHRIGTIPHLDLIVADILMPGMDGWELLEKIMESETYKEIPFIFLTAVTDDQSEMKGFALGAEEYIKKSTPIDIILTRIDSTIRRAKKIKKEKFAALKRIMKEFNTRQQYATEDNYENTLNEILHNIHHFCIRHEITKKEKQVFARIVYGRTNKEIANEFSTSINTVKTQVESIFNKCDIRSRKTLKKMFSNIT